MLPLILLLLPSALASGLSVLAGGDARRQLLERYHGGPIPQPKQVTLPFTQSSVSSRQLQQANVTSAQSLAAQDEPEQVKRALKMVFYNKLDDSRSQAEKDYIMDKLLPATASVLARSLRVREPTGPLPLEGFIDEAGGAIPAPEGALNSTNPPGYDADIVMKITSLPSTSPECEGLLAGAAAHLLENTSRRPVFGYVIFCNVDPSDFESDLATAIHEIMHALGMDPVLFDSFLGYPAPTDIVQTYSGGRAVIKTPQVRHKARAHLGCDTLVGAELEDDGIQGSAGSHWEQRIFEGEVMDSVGGWGNAHHYKHVLTDLTLALFQDSGWYDVKYGSAGFNSFGYKAGCTFAQGSYEEAMAEPSAAQYLCPEIMDKRYTCLHDYSGDGVCYSSPEWDGFYRALPGTAESVDCQGTDGDRGQRCLKRKAERWPECIAMSCSDAGKVLIDGTPCDPDTMDCPPDAAMCDEPGYLLCVDTLNDCSGKGDCFRGNCYCHLGWGGPDCSVPVCTGECEDGSLCPPSGFCGVPDCGTWSNGSDDRGIACYSARDAAVPGSLTPAREPPADSLRPSVVVPIGVQLPTAPPAEVPAPAPAPVNITGAPANVTGPAGNATDIAAPVNITVTPPPLPPPPTEPPANTTTGTTETPRPNPPPIPTPKPPPVPPATSANATDGESMRGFSMDEPTPPEEVEEVGSEEAPATPLDNRPATPPPTPPTPDEQPDLDEARSVQGPVSTPAAVAVVEEAEADTAARAVFAVLPLAAAAIATAAVIV